MRECSTTTRICLSCEHWKGERKIIKRKNGDWKFVSPCRTGMCSNPQSSFYQKSRRADTKCVKHDYKTMEVI